MSEQHVQGDLNVADTIHNNRADRINIYQGSKPEVSWPIRVGRSPRSTLGALERETDRLLASAPAPEDGALLSHVLSGMGGVGKTQLAARLANRLWNARELDLLVWIDASSRESIAADMRIAAARVSGRSADDPEGDAQDFLNQLDGFTDKRWMVVFDNVTDPNDLNDFYPPDNPNGRMVITTRRRDAAFNGYGAPVAVDVFTPQEAMDFLRGRLSDTKAMRGAERLSEALGCLPLALAQAAAYIEDRPGFSCEQYLKLFSDRSAGLAKLAPESLPDGHVEPYAVTCSLSLEAAEQQPHRGVARAVLRLACMLSPNGIPSDILDTVAGRRYLRQSLDSATGEDAVNDDTSTDVLSRLNKFSVLDWDGSRFRVHALIQRVVFDRMNRHEKEETANVAADALLKTWPDRGRDFTAAALLRANALTLFQQSGDALLKPAVHTLLYRAGDSLGAAGHAKAAEEHFTVLAERLGHIGDRGRRDVVKVKDRKARWGTEAGDPVSAVEERRSILETLRKRHSERHFETMRARRRLATALGNSRAVDDAIAELTALRDFQIERFGANDQETLVTRRELARWIGESGDPERAIRELGEVLAEQRRTLPEGDPQILITRKYRARWLGEVGEYERVITEFQAIVKMLEAEHGERHELPLEHRFKLIQWMRKAGRRRQALIEFERLLEDQRKAGHPATLSTRRHLAVLHGDLGDHERSLEELEQLLRETRDRMGETDRKAFRVRREIATCRGNLGDHAAAVAELEQLLDDQLKVLPADAPENFHVRECLAHQRREAGDMDGAIAERQRLLDDRIRLRGEGHPDTNRTRRQLEQYRREAAMLPGPPAEGEASPRERAALEDEEWRGLSLRSEEARRQWDSGEWSGAILAQERAIAEYERRGVDARLVLREYKRLVKWHEEVGDHANAVLVQRQCVDRAKKRFGEYSPTLDECRRQLALQLHQAGACAEAVAEHEQLIADHDRFNVALNQRFKDRANLARCRAESGDHSRALAEMRQLRKDERAILPEGHNLVFRSWRKIVELCIEVGRFPDAVSEAEALVAERRRLHGPDGPRVRKARAELADVYGRTGREDAAAALLRTLVEESTAANGERSEETQRLRGRLERWRTESGEHP
ncbi:tetratricopeptide repeat protein [Glycomyces tenuis]|uniref:tetratricopeptide repeat protein n=1 Tax=Glycomyces tenuis TaxID=58116 RepID=UPI00047970B6|nr:tetratricopeptide repeat protein [Glycomyces tenuis]